MVQTSADRTPPTEPFDRSSPHLHRDAGPRPAPRPGQGPGPGRHERGLVAWTSLALGLAVALTGCGDATPPDRAAELTLSTAGSAPSAGDGRSTASALAESGASSATGAPPSARSSSTPRPKPRATADQGEAAPLWGTVWRIDQLLEDDVPTDLPARGTLRFLREEPVRVILGTDCNGGGGEITVTDESADGSSGRITLLEGLRRRAPRCHGPGAELDDLMSTVIRGSMRYRIDGDRLTLTMGDCTLRLSAA